MENIKYTLTLNDVKDYAKYLHKIPRIRKVMMKTHIRFYLVLFICMFVIFWAAIGGGQINWADMSVPLIIVILKYFLMILIGYLVLCTLLWVISTRDLFGTSSRTMFRYLKGQSLDVELKIVDEGIWSSNGKFSGVMNWEGIIDIYKSEKSIFIFKGDYVAYIIPERAFENKEKFNEFFEFVENKIKENKIKEDK